MKYTIILTIFTYSTLLLAQTGKWQILPSDFDNDLHGVYFTDSLTGYICGENGLILKTTDGINWFTQQTPTNQTFYDVKFANDTIGWACGDSGTIISTQNGGTIWEIVSENYLKPLVSLDIHEGANGYSIWVVGDLIGALKKFNQDWIVYNLDMRSNFIIFRDDIVPNAIINDSIFLWEGFNYGTIWTYLWLFYDEQLAITRLYKTEYGLWSNNFWFVGRNGSAHYCDMPFFGWPIYTATTPVNSDLLSVAVDESAHMVWAVGIDGKIIVSENEGVSYNLYDSPVSENLNDIFFSGFETGYIVGDDGKILHYDNDWIIKVTETYSNKLIHSYPNPFQSEIRIDFPENIGKIQYIAIYDLYGNLIKKVDLPNNISIKPGIVWNGFDKNNNNVKEGIYYIIIKSNNSLFTSKLIKLN